MRQNIVCDGLEPQFADELAEEEEKKKWRTATKQTICDRGLGKSKIVELDDDIKISMDVNTLASTPTPTTISMLQPIASAIVLIMVSIFWGCHATGVCKCMSSP